MESPLRPLRPFVSVGGAFCGNRPEAGDEAAEAFGRRVASQWPEGHAEETARVQPERGARQDRHFELRDEAPDHLRRPRPAAWEIAGTSEPPSMARAKPLLERRHGGMAGENVTVLVRNQTFATIKLLKLWRCTVC